MFSFFDCARINLNKEIFVTSQYVLPRRVMGFLRFYSYASIERELVLLNDLCDSVPLWQSNLQDPEIILSQKSRFLKLVEST